MRSARAALAALCAVLGGGCWEFIEPEFAEQDASTVLQVNASLGERGIFNLSGILVPGLDEDGFVREVVRDTLFVFGLPVPSDSTTPAGSLIYQYSTQLSAGVAAGRFTIDPPVVSGISSGPRVEWSTPRSLEPDTIRMARGADLLIRLAYDSTQAAPRPNHQWFLELSNNVERFQISSNGPPPAQLLVPAMWIPQPRDSVVHVFFTSSQSALVFLNDYRGAYNYTVQFDHTIVIR